jgi:acetyl-CoA C-acetyltransferase
VGLNEAFAVQVLYCADKLGIPFDSTSMAAPYVGHPYGVTGQRLTGHRIIEEPSAGQARVRHDVYGGGMGAAGVFEVL